MFTALAVSALAFHHWGGGLFFLLIPLFWIVLVVILFAIFGRRWRKRHSYGPGMGGYGPHAYWARAQSASNAESTLAQRFANGDIDEKEYRARLEVIRANGPVPPTS